MTTITETPITRGLRAAGFYLANDSGHVWQKSRADGIYVLLRDDQDVANKWLVGVYYWSAETDAYSFAEREIVGHVSNAVAWCDDALANPDRHIEF